MWQQAVGDDRIRSANQPELHLSSEPQGLACWGTLRAETIRDCLGNVVFGEGDTRLQDAVVGLLQRAGVTLATIEWGTCGLLAQWLAEAAGERAVYRGGIVAPGTESWLHACGGVNPAERANQPASGPCLTAAVQAVRQRTGADWCVGIGPFPERLSTERTPRHVQLALATGQRVRAHDSRYSGHPDLLPARFAKLALNLVRLELLKRGSDQCSPPRK